VIFGDGKHDGLIVAVGVGFAGVGDVLVERGADDLDVLSSIEALAEDENDGGVRTKQDGFEGTSVVFDSAGSRDDLADGEGLLVFVGEEETTGLAGSVADGDVDDSAGATGTIVGFRAAA